MRRRADLPKHIPIVEVDAPGCSYNPDKNHHEEVVAAAVADEMQKGLDVEMRAKGPPKHVSWQPEFDPLLQLQVYTAHPVCVSVLGHSLYSLSGCARQGQSCWSLLTENNREVDFQVYPELVQVCSGALWRMVAGGRMGGRGEWG